MSTPTPRTDAVYLEHRHWANEDEATEAIEDLRDLARTLERELAAEREKVRVLQEAMKFLANKDMYLQVKFDPCQRASAAIAATEDKQ